jgi:hypothetical protein
MRILPHNHRPNEAGFTLAETMVASAVFTMIMASIVALQLFGARTTSGVTRMFDSAARANVVHLIANDVKNCRSVAVQNYSGSTFSSIALGSPQQGNALRVVVPVGNVTQTNYYYVDSTGDLWQWNSSSSTNTSRRYLTDVTNTVVFSSVDYTGAVISNSIARTLIQMRFSVLDDNPQNFRQIMELRVSAEVRNQ